MDELIFKILQGRATPAEEDQLRSWRRESLSNESRYREIAELWTLTGRAASSSGTGARRPSAAEVLRKDRPRDPYRIATKGYRVAAAIALVALGASIGGLAQRKSDPQVFAPTEFVTGASELVTTRLTDGSIVRLAPHSRLRISASTASRDVWLEGRAFFAVAHDEGRTFTVRTRAGDALVLGTRFEVVAENDDLRVLVLEGRVAVDAGGERMEVNAGEISRSVDGTAPALLAVDDVQPMLDWMGQFLVFENTPLSRAAGEIESRYGTRIHFEDPSIADRTVTAWFSDQSLDEVLMVICRVADARCVISDSNVFIRPY